MCDERPAHKADTRAESPCPGGISGERQAHTSYNCHRRLAALRAGVSTALPLAVVERRRARRESCLITELVPDTVDLDQVALTLLPRLEPRRQRAVKDAIAQAVVDLFVRLEKHGFAHRDLKASNILLTDWDGQEGPTQVWLVDLQGLRLHGHSERRRRQQLVRLGASLLGYAAVTRADCVRFFQAYLTPTGRPREHWKGDLRELAARAEDYVRRARRRKQHKLDGYLGDS